mgnify:CR=1 FL=1
MSQSVIEWEILRMFPSDKFDEFDRLVRQEIIRLQPRKPEDGTSFFIAYNAGDKRMLWLALRHRSVIIPLL